MANYIIPATRRAFDYTAHGANGVGRVGGIPSAAWTEVELDIDNTGATDVTSAINTALNERGAQEVVKLDAGRFRIDGGIRWPQYGGLLPLGNEVALRGSGMNETVLAGSYRPQPILEMGQGITWPDVFNPTGTINAGLTRGSTTLTITNIANMKVGCIARIYLGSDPSLFKYVGDTEGFWYYHVIILSKNVGAGTVEITPPVHQDFSSQHGEATITTFQLDGMLQYDAGIEDLTFEKLQGGASTMIINGSAYGCWLKNVKFYGNPDNYHLLANDSVRLEIDSCIFDGTSFVAPTNGITFIGITAGLIQNTVLDRCEPLYQGNAGNVGCAMFGVYALRAKNSLAYNTHSPLNDCNLIEYSKWDTIQIDGYHGPERRLLANGSWITSRTVTSGGEIQDYCIAFKRDTHYCTLHDCVLQTPGTSPTTSPYSLGQPYMGNSAYNGTRKHSAADYAFDFNSALMRPKSWTGTVTSKSGPQDGVVTFAADVATDMEASLVLQQGALSTRSRVLNGFLIEMGTKSGNTFPVHFLTFSATLPNVGTSVTFYPSALGFTELDEDCFATYDGGTNLFYGNFIAHFDRIPANEAYGVGETPHGSLVYPAGAPDWWGGRPWPPYSGQAFDAMVSYPTAQEMRERIPAYDLWANGGPSGIVGQPVFSPAAGSYPVTQTVTITSSTGDATIRYTTDGSTPTNSHGTIYSAPIEISATTTLKAIAYNGVDPDSTVREGTFSIVAVCEDPEITPAGGSFLGGQVIEITCPTPGATIRYTIDGSEPSSAFGNIYSAPFTLAISGEVKAIAYKTGMADSSIVEEVYDIFIPVDPPRMTAERLNAPVITLGDPS